MQFVSTRDSSNKVGFKQAVLDCMPLDGGLFVPDDCEDLRRWILYADENTSFSNLAGSLTSALINKEFSPIICETIATRAFPFSPELKRLDEKLYILELFNGPTGTYKDFGVSYLTSTLETILQLDGEKSILLDATSGEFGACLAKAMRGKKLLKSVVLCPKGKLRGMEESDFVWNGGNIYPVEVDGTEEDCHNLVRAIYADRSNVEKYHLTVANTANIGRLLPQAFFYTYAFSRLKKTVYGDIFYALAAGNYGNVVSGLYGWKLSLPVNGFILPTTDNLKKDVMGRCTLLDSFIPVQNRSAADPSDPSNLERLEQIFQANSLMLHNFVYPADVSEEEINAACKELYMKYHLFADRDTCSAYAASKLRSDVYEDDEGVVVLVARQDPSMDSDFIKHNLGDAPGLPERIQKAFQGVNLNRPVIAPDDIESLISVLNSLNLLRIF